MSGLFDDLMPSSGRGGLFDDLIPPLPDPPKGPGRLPSDIPRQAQEVRASRPAPGAVPPMGDRGALERLVMGALTGGATPPAMTAPASPAVPVTGGSPLAAVPRPMPAEDPVPRRSPTMPTARTPRADVGTPAPPQGERAPSLAEEGLGPVMRRHLTTPVAEGTKEISGGGKPMSATDRAQVLKMANTLPAEAQLAILEFVDQAVMNGDMTVSEAMVYAMRNLETPTTEVPRTGLRGLFGGTKEIPGTPRVKPIDGPELPPGFVLD